MDVRTELLHYFELEKSWAVGLAVFGVAACALGVSLWLAKGAYRAAAIPIGLVAVLELGIGVGIAARTDKQVSELLQRLEAKQDMGAEQARMERVARTFEIAKGVEIALFAIGVTLTYALRSSDFAFSLGVGLITQSVALLLFDLIAARRADVYLSALSALSSTA
jgi:hypothetical protein